MTSLHQLPLRQAAVQSQLQQEKKECFQPCNKVQVSNLFVQVSRSDSTDSLA